MQRLPKIAVLLLVAASSCCASPHGNSNATATAYRNSNYGFNVALSPREKLLRASEPSPNHGFGVDVPGARLWADASYTDSPSADEEIKSLTAGCAIRERKPTSLGSSSALAVRFSCPKSGDHEAYEEMLVVTVRRVGDRSPADYQVGMAAPDSQLISKYMSTFNSMVAGFHFEK